MGRSAAIQRRKQIFFPTHKNNCSGNNIVEAFKQIYSANTTVKKEDPREYISNR